MSENLSILLQDKVGKPLKSARPLTPALVWSAICVSYVSIEYFWGFAAAFLCALLFSFAIAVSRKSESGDRD